MIVYRIKAKRFNGEDMEEKKSLILFIHGLLGDDDTWGNFENLLTKHERSIFEKYDVKFFSYPSAVFENPKIQTIAASLRTSIENEYDGYDDIVLVCHSMGGLVAKKYLIDEIKLYQPSTLKVKKVIYYDTPHNGADLANWAKITGHKQVAQMATDSDFIEWLNTDFYTLDIGQYLCMKYVIAEKAYKGIRIVSKQSASAIWANRDTETLVDKHHKDCCKPQDIDALSYKILKNFILKECPRRDLTAQPYLEKKTLKSKTELNKLNYKNDFIPFVGREKELAFLDEFCAQDKSFLWTVLYEDGGTGKSRLAFEYVKRLYQKANNAGFYTLSDDFSWQDWIPSGDTFIVLDYAGSNPDDIKKMLEKLSTRSDRYSKKVRVLLLERRLDSPNDWYQSKLLGGSGNTLMDSLYKEPLPIGLLDDSHLVSIAQSFSLNIDKTAFIAQLEKIDVKKRPLFAAIFAENFSIESENLDKITLIKAYLKRTKEKYWTTLEHNDFILVGLITMLGGADVDNLEDILNDCCPVSIDMDKLQTILEYEGESLKFRGIEPDLLGELYVLELFGRHGKNRLFSSMIQKEQSNKILQYMWEKAPLEMVIFLERIREDYLKHEALFNIDNGEHCLSETSSYLYALHSVNLINDWREQDINKAKKLFENLQALSAQYPQNEEIVVEVAKASFNLINDWGEQDINKAQKLFENLQALSAQYPQNEEIVVLVAKASVNLINDWGEQDISKAQEIVTKLIPLIERFPKNDIMIQIANMLK